MADNRCVQYPTYDPRIDATPLDDAELEALDTLLQGLPSDLAMNVEALDGYLSALVLGPRLATRIPAARWMPPIWGGDGDAGAPFTSQKQRKRVVMSVLRHLRSVDRALAGPPEAWQPIFSIADSDDGERVDAEDWCVGFLQAVALDADAWAEFWDDELLAPLSLLGADEDSLGEAQRRRLDDPDERDAASRAVADAVGALVALRR